MKNNRKKIILIILGILIFIRIGYIWIGNKVDKQYYVSSELDLTSAKEIPCGNVELVFQGRQGRLNSIEVIFGRIMDNESGKVRLRIFHNNELMYQTDIPLSEINNYEWKKIYVNYPLEEKEYYTVALNTMGDCAQVPTVLVLSEDTAAPEMVSSLSEGNDIGGQIAVRYGYLSEPSILDKIILTSLWLLLWGIILSVIESWEKIKSHFIKFLKRSSLFIKPEISFAITEIILCYIIINFSGIDFQEFTIIIFYLLSLCAVIDIKRKKDYVSKLTDTVPKRFLLCFLCLYAAFALVGQRIWVYPLDLESSVSGIVIYISAVIWFVPVILSVLYGLQYLRIVLKRTDAKITTGGKLYLGLTLCLLLPALYNLYANNPGISSMDTLLSMGVNAHNLHGMRDWHPLFYCIVLRLIQKIWDSTYAVILAQYFFWAYVMLEIFTWLREKGMKDGAIMIVALFSGLNAANFLYLNTIWKDIPYALSLLWAFIILVKLSIDYEKYRRKWYIYFEFIIALIGICFYRKNGIVTFIVIIVMTAIILRKNIKIWCSLTITIVLFLFVKYPVYDYFEVEDLGHWGQYIGLGQDILGVYYSGGEISEETLKMVTIMTGYNNGYYDYNPTYANQSYDLDVDTKEFIFNYMDTFIKNPILMIRAVVAREDVLWDIFAGEDAIVGTVNYYDTFDGQMGWNDYYPKRKYTSLYADMAAFTTYTAENQWISAIVWRTGLFTLMGMVALAFLYMKGRVRKYFLMIAPVMGQVLSLLLSTGWSDFRYFWPLNLMNMCVVLVVLVVPSESNWSWESGSLNKTV